MLSSDNNKTLYRAVDVTSEQSINDSPFTLLAKIANLQSSTPEGVIALEKLANLPLSHWLACSTQSNLLDVEPLFFNQQPEKTQEYGICLTIRHHNILTQFAYR
ncbi:hypothetical protein [Shewanella sp. ENK2]|uniref:hypothetical protein n=1 Tax=Shewanella sp. ENK2 TaxID=2775245 RepID=UPI003749B697